jgi:hypothetical protein
VQTPAAPACAHHSGVPTPPDTLARIAAGFGASVGTAHADVTAVTGLLADRAPGEREPQFVLLDGTLAECDRVGDSRADYSAKHRRYGVNVQAVTDPAGEVLWISPTLPGRTHDLTAARTHRIIRICERQGVPILADRVESPRQRREALPRHHTRRPAHCTHQHRMEGAHGMDSLFPSPVSTVRRIKPFRPSHLGCNFNLRGTFRAEFIPPD